MVNYPLYFKIGNTFDTVNFDFPNVPEKNDQTHPLVLLLALLVFEKHSPSDTEVPSSSGEAAVTHCGTCGRYPPLKGILSSHEQNEQEGARVNFSCFIDSWCFHCIVNA